MSLTSFYASLDALQLEIRDIGDRESKALGMRDALLESLATLESPSGVDAAHPLATINHDFAANVRQLFEQARSEWDAKGTMRDLSETYQDRLMLLVFGKVNVGKSALINLLADHFSDLGLRYLRLVRGHVQEVEGPFEEGCTETTATIQWIEVGDRLVIMDSPGLHSVTEENGELARRFTDAADGLIWMTSSRFPAQVEELNALSEEIQSKKPLIPVLSRSDIDEEDEDENGEIVNCFYPKPDKNRREQEDFICQQGGEFLARRDAQCELRDAVSISVRYFHEQGQTQDAAHQSGIDRLAKALVSLSEEARRYKAGKASQQVENYLRRSVLQPVNGYLKESVTALQRQVEEELQRIKGQQGPITASVTAELHAEVDRLVERFRGTQDGAGLAKALESLIADRVNRDVNHLIEGCISSFDGVFVELAKGELNGFSPVTAKVRQTSGSGLKALCSSLAGVGGAVAGGFVGGLPGAVAGGVLGGGAGGYAGNGLVSENWVDVDTGVVDVTRVLEAAHQQVDQTVPSAVGAAIDEITTVIQSSEDYLNRVQSALTQCERDVAALTRDE